MNIEKINKTPYKLFSGIEKHGGYLARKNKETT
jgi:hypothetical protein